MREFLMIGFLIAGVLSIASGYVLGGGLLIVGAISLLAAQSSPESLTGQREEPVEVHDCATCRGTGTRRNGTLAFACHECKGEGFVLVPKVRS